MLTILGPAKTIDNSPHGITELHDYPTYLEQAEELVNLLRKYSITRLKRMMWVSEKLATLTFERYASWRRSYPADEGQQAILAFSGEVFNGLKARSLSEEDLKFAHEHVRILSGLYGVMSISGPYNLHLFHFKSSLLPSKNRSDQDIEISRFMPKKPGE